MARSKVKSLTPYGQVNEYYKKRLEWDFQNSWRERLMARLWEHENRTDSRNRPIILMTAHECTPECAKAVMLHRQFDPPHHYHKPTEADVKHISATMQWLGTNIGFHFLEGYMKLVEKIGNTPSKEREKVFNEEIKKLSAGL